MSRFESNEIDLCINLFQLGRSSKEVQDYLIDKYNLRKRSFTSNFVKVVRKKMGIYNKLNKE